MDNSPLSSADPHRSALDQLIAFGLEVAAIEPDGVLHRVKHREDKAGSKNGWYVAQELRTYAGRILVVGAYGWWKAGDLIKHLKHDSAGLSIDEQREIEARRRDAETRAKAGRATEAAEAAARACKIWPTLPTEGPSEYLARKRIPAIGVRFARGAVVVPLRTGPTDADLVGLQWIHPDGTKRFLTGTAKRGAWCLLGDPPNPGAVLAIGEGYATCASVHGAMGWTCAVAFDAGNLLDVAKVLRQLYPGVRLLLLADDDHATRGNPGVTKAAKAARAVHGILAVPRFVSSAPDRGTDWNDLHCTEGRDSVRAQLESLLSTAGTPPPPATPEGSIIQGDFPGNEWRQRLQRTEKGSVRATAFNTRIILENDPSWRGVLGWCEFSHTVQKRQPPPLPHAARGEWEDADDGDLRFWLAEHYGIEPKGQDLVDAVHGTARALSFHPVRDYLDALHWDGIKRLAWWLSIYLGCGDESDIPPDERQSNQARYHELVGTLWLIQAISRIRQPGLKADAVLILEGIQGVGKSTALRVLFGDAWFSDTPIEIGSKDAYEAIRGLWGFEMAELDSLNKADATRAKAFFSSPKDRFRMPYGHRAKSYTRQCVIAGTTNQYTHLRDHTGNRRFWSVSVGIIDLGMLAKDRDQLWAEADHLFRTGAQWWPTPADLHLFEAEQEARLDGDVWETIISAHLSERIRLTPPKERATLTISAAEIMSYVLKIDTGMMRRPEQTRVGLIMIGLGWRPCKLGSRMQRLRGYRPGHAYLMGLDAEPLTEAPF